MEAEFGNVLLRTIGAEPAAADMLMALDRKNGPILKIVPAHAIDFRGELFGDGLVGEGPAEVAGDFCIAPKFAREREIGGSPAAEAEPRGGEEIESWSRNSHEMIVALNAEELTTHKWVPH